MHFVLKFENLHPGMDTAWSDLRRIIEMAERIFPKHKVEVHVEYYYAREFVVDPYRETMILKNPIVVSLSPLTNLPASQLNPQYDSIVRKLVMMINQFLAASDPLNDSSVQPDYFPETEISISAGFGVSKYINGEQA